MKYKMLVLDLDGTLLNDEKQISEKNIEALTILHNKNMEIVIATGRNYYMAKMLVEKIKHLNPLILANNGSIIREINNDEILEYNYLAFNEFEEIYNEGLKLDLNPVVHVDEYANGFDLLYEKDDYEKEYLGYIKKDDERAKHTRFSSENMNKILSVCYFDDYDKLCDFEHKMKQQNNNRFNTICNRNISKKALLEFLHPYGCKWSAIKKYALSKGIGIDEIVAIGDDNNDIELLRNSGLGIAMINGTKEAIKASKITTLYDNNNSGVYYALAEIFKF